MKSIKAKKVTDDRQNVTKALVYLRIYEATDQRLFELPVARLERQLKRFLATSHPHTGFNF